MAEHLLDSQDTRVRFPYRLPRGTMSFRGTFKIKNLRSGDKITVGPRRNNVSPYEAPSGPAQYLTVNGIDYLIRKSGSTHRFFANPSFNKYNNKLVDVEGVFVGQVIIISSIVQV